MKLSTLCFCLKGDQVLLAMKKRGFGVGKWNGYGGKVQVDETPVAAAVRELAEESHLVATEAALQQVALIKFYFETEPLFECSVFLLKDWQGEPKETEEMKPQWFAKDQLPFADMWIADCQWIPMILAGQTFEAEVIFNQDGSELVNFSSVPRVFGQ